MYYSRFLSLLFFLSLYCSLDAQNMYIHKKDADISSIQLKYNQKITFSAGNMIVKSTGGSIQTFPMSNIQSINFSENLINATPKVNATNPISIYPNPVHGEVNIETFATEIHLIQFYTLDGKLCKTAHVDSSNRIHQISTSDLETGIYICRLIGNTSITTKRIIKQ